jgi:hypothetical protein
MCVALAALDARVLATGPAGERSIALTDFHRLPGDTPQIDSNLRADEIITAIELPPKGFPRTYTYLTTRDRLSYAFALVSVAVGLEIEGGTIREARLALGGVAHKPWRDREAEAELNGTPATRESFARGADTVLRSARGFGHNDFKVELARRAIVRALTQAALDQVTAKLGDSTLPDAPVEGGSFTTSSVGSAIHTVCRAVQEELLQFAQQAGGSPLAGARLDQVTFAGGKIRRDDGREMSIADAIRAGKVDRIEKEANAEPDENSKYAHFTHSAIFAEVKIDEQLGVIRVTRVVSAVAAGRILNPKVAGSQIIGAVVGGIGMALHEETATDHRFGRFMTHNLADYHVPTSADVQAIDVIFVEERDQEINQLGIKGVGEIGIVGTAAAIANAIYHATGKRIRDLPITIDRLMRW